MRNSLLLSISLLAIMSPAIAQDNSKSMPASGKEMDMTKAKNEAQYRANLMALGSMSLMTSQMAQDKASNNKVKEFARFEVAEQTAIASVLTDMKTPQPPMNPKDQAMMDQLKSASGAEFDKAYVEGSLKTHEKLEDLGENYLNTKVSSMEEMHAHHLATVTLPTIKQHIMQAKELSGSMR